MNSSSKNSFSLKSTNAEFAQRQKNVFDQLKVLENNRKNSSEQRMETEQIDSNRIDTNRRTQRSVTKHFRGKESIFKKPQNPVPKNYFKRMPDFKKNPHKWTRYSLEDVRDEDISDKGNTKAALSFLRELEERKCIDMECDTNKSNDLPARIIFKKQTSTNIKPKENEDTDTKPSFRNSKVIMPEYVVGQKEKKERRNKSIKDAARQELKLDHLFENEEDE